MTTDLQPLVQHELDSNEKILWTGRPNPKRHLLTSLPIVLFGIFWTGFALFWTAGAAGFKIPDFSKIGVQTLFPLFGLPFILIGLGMLSAPFWIYRKALKTVYALTDKRCLVISTGWSKSVESYSDEDIGTITRTERPDGSGDIIFSSEEVHTRKGSRTKSIGFFGIQNVRAVEKMVRDIFKKNQN